MKVRITAVTDETANSYIFPQGARWAAIPRSIKAITKNNPMSQVRLIATFVILLFLFCVKEIENSTKFIARMNMEK
jgi:hypothetical protein